MAIPDEIVLIEYGKVGPAGTGVTAGDWTAIRSDVDDLQAAQNILGPGMFDFESIVNNAVTTSTSAMAEAYNAAPTVLPSPGTWRGLFLFDGTIRRTANTGGFTVDLIIDGLNTAAKTYASYVGGTIPFQVRCRVGNFTTFPNVRCRYRGDLTAASTVLENARLYGQFWRTA